MKARYRLIASILAIPLVVVAGYYLVSPKAIVLNLSDNNYDEFVISLPSSRISFSPVIAGSSSTIFYSHQNQSGVGSYSLISESTEILQESFSYPEGSDFGRVLRFTIESDGQVSIGN